MGYLDDDTMYYMYIFRESKDVYIVGTQSLPSLVHYYIKEGWPIGQLNRVRQAGMKAKNLVHDEENDCIWMTPNSAVLASHVDEDNIYPIPNRSYRITSPDGVFIEVQKKPDGPIERIENLLYEYQRQHGFHTAFDLIQEQLELLKRRF